MGREYVRIEDPDEVFGCTIHNWYENKIYFGAGGSDEQNKADLTGNPYVSRPVGIDCNTG